MKLAFKKWVENIQNAAYNGTHMVTVSIFLGLASTPWSVTFFQVDMK